MARIGGKSPSYIKELSTNDKTVVQLANDNDSSITLAQLSCIPIASCSTASGTASKTATINANSIFKNNFAIQHSFQRDGSTVSEYLIGLTVKVQFSNKNTVDAPTLNIGGTGALPITVNGVRMGAGVLGAGNYKFTLVPYGNSYAWECEDNGGRVSVSGDVVTNSSIEATPLNSALANYQQEKETNAITFASSFNGKQLKKNNVLTIQGLITFASKVTAYTSLIGTWVNKPNSPTSFYINGVLCYTSGNYIYSQADINAGTYFIDYVAGYSS